MHSCHHLFPAALLALIATVLPGFAADPLHHDIVARIDPASHTIAVVDRFDPSTVIESDAEGGYRFVLHSGLEPRVTTEGWQLESTAGEARADFLGINATTETVADEVPLEGWRLVPDEGAGGPIEIRYSGAIHHSLEQQGEEYQRSFSETPGVIDDRGVYLAGTSFWVPSFGDGLVTFELEVKDLSPGWEVVSQGERFVHSIDDGGGRTVGWRFMQPTEEIYLVGGPLQLFEDRQGETEVYAYLRSPDAALATRYLEATKRYLKLYEAMLPTYPFPSFALVENFWETGYGMPGFTLLGPKVIRFPWILTSSYPHELLHNWWGNSVYVDFDRGNWCEGLTAYMADHLFAEQRGEGATYRRSTLKKFTDLVSDETDFPLVDFHSRSSAASEAIGYGKSLMLFHMMRRAVGDTAFLESVGRFYRERQFNRAGFDDLAAAFSDTTGLAWGPMVEAWTTRTGAPQLVIEDVVVEKHDHPAAPWTVTVTIRQVVTASAFPLTVPIAVTIEGYEEAVWFESEPCGKTCTIRVPCPARPLRIDVDPAFDVMRKLDPLEVPPAISTVMGGAETLFVLPSEAPAAELEAWRDLATAWAAPDPVEIVNDVDLDVLPEQPTWVLGWSNGFASEIVRRLEDHGVVYEEGVLTLDGIDVEQDQRSVVLVARGDADSAVAVGWVAARPVAAIPGLARKLPHYQKYSYLVFRGDEPENTDKGMWNPVGSPLVRNLGEDELIPLVLPERAPLAELPPIFDAAAFERTVTVLADPSLEGRGLGSRGLDDATRWVEEQMAAIGLTPRGTNGFRQTWSWLGGDPERELELTNIVAMIPGADPALADAPVLIMAHLDHLGLGWPDVREGNEGKIHPGADDNASGVAVLLELARSLRSEPPRDRPIIFAVVTGEEAGLIGSRHLLGTFGEGDQPVGCFNLDTVGRLSSGKLYVLNASSAREWRFIFMGVGYTTGAPVEVVSEPLDASDQVACLDRGIPAIQLFTGPSVHYHRPSDTADTLDYEGMATVAEAAREAVVYLADRVEPLTVSIEQPPGSAPSPHGAGERGTRRVSLGTMPDFAFKGPGVRVQAVTPDSGADKAGIKPGDVLLTLDDKKIEGLRSLSGILKTHQPGDEVRVTIMRSGEEMMMTATLGAR